MIAVVCLGLAACTQKFAADGLFRSPASQVYSNAVFDVKRLEGQWDQVAAFAAVPTATCAPGEAAFIAKGGSLSATYQLCLSGQVVAGAGAVSIVGPGRFAVSGKGGIGQDWWVLWVDEGYRTLVIGNPSGEFGFILNRGRSLPPDRLAAAKEVLDFNGYDTEKLMLFGG